MSSPMHYQQLALVWGFLLFVTTASILFAQCGCACSKKKKKKTVNKKGKPKAGAAGKGKAKTGAAIKPAAGAAKKGSGGDAKVKPPQKSKEPKFGAIKSDLMSYEEANQQLRRNKPEDKPRPTAPPPPAPVPPPTKPKPTPSAITAQPKLVVEKPQENVGMASTPEYDTLNFVRENDIFGSGEAVTQNAADDKAPAPTPAAEPADDADQEQVESVEGQPVPGMAAQGDYETLADLNKDDIFSKELQDN